MLRLKRLMVLHHPNPTSLEASTANLIGGRRRSHEQQEMLFLSSQKITYRFLDIFQMGNKASIEKERARLSDEMNRGYFADISELKKHGGKIAMANSTIIPAIQAVKFPELEVNFSKGRCIKLPITSDEKVEEAEKMTTARASLVCLSFRASSQGMINSWSMPFVDAFSSSKSVRIYEVSLIESWFLSLKPVKWLLLRIMQKPKTDGNDTLQRQMVYSFGDKYYFRKELKILNLLTGYIFLLDRFGRIRWQGFGLATEEEVKSLVSCASLLLKEK